VFALSGAHQLGNLQPDLGRDLLGLAEIRVRGLLQGRAVELDYALIALRVGALVDGERQHALPEQRAGRGLPRTGQCFKAVGVIASIGAQRAGRREIGDEHVDRTVGARLQDELALELQRRAEQHGDKAGLGQKAGHRLGIVVPAENAVEQRSELDDAAARVERGDLEGDHMVFAGKAEIAELLHVRHVHSFQHRTSPACGDASSRKQARYAQFSGDAPKIGITRPAFKRRDTRRAPPSGHAAGSRLHRIRPNSARRSPRR
jgi:hypothetical protein